MKKRLILGLLLAVGLLATLGVVYDPEWESLFVQYLRTENLNVYDGSDHAILVADVEVLHDADLDTWIGISPHASWQDVLDGTTTTSTNASTIRAQLAAAPIYDNRDYANLAAAITAIGATVGELHIWDAETLTASAVFPSTLGVVIHKGGSIVKAASWTLTINGPFEAGNFQVFGPALGVTFAIGALDTIKAAWFGVSTSATGAANSAAITLLLAGSQNGHALEWPFGIVQIDTEIDHTKTNQRWFTMGGAQAYSTGGCQLKQTVNTQRVLHVTGSYNLYEGMTFNGNSTTTDTVLLDSASAGYHKFINCLFMGCSSVDAGQGALNIQTILTTVDNCLILGNGGNGLVLGTASNITVVRGGSVTSSATTGTANTAGIKVSGGASSSILDMAIEDNGKTDVATTGGITIGSDVIDLRIKGHFEGNYNYDICTTGSSYNLDISDCYFLGRSGTGTAILLGGGPLYTRIIGNYSWDHLNFLNITSTATYVDVHDNESSDTNYLVGTTYNNSVGGQYRIVDPVAIPSGTQNLIQYFPPSGGALTLAGASKFEHNSGVRFGNRPSLLLRGDGANNCWGVYTIPISSTTNTFLRGKWVTCSFYATTSDASSRVLTWYMEDAVTQATAGANVGANYVWAKIGGSLRVDAAANTLTFKLQPQAGYDIYVGGILLTVGIDNYAQVDRSVPVEYRFAAVPTTGSWDVGDIVWNSAPASGQPPYWMCGTAPLTFLPAANLP